MTTQADKKEFWFAVLVTVIGLAAVLPAQVPVPAEAVSVPAEAVSVAILHGGGMVPDVVEHGASVVPVMVERVVEGAAGTTERVAAAVPVAAVPAAAAAVPVAAERKIVVSLADRKLAVVEDGKVVAIYKVAVGKTSTPSPAGEFRIVSRVANPAYYHEGKVVAPGPRNPVGTRWMGLSEKGYGIHGTNMPGSIGRAASHGCIRVGRRDLEKLFTMVQVGDVVEIRGERDAELAAIFGSRDAKPGIPSAPAVSGASVMVAQTAPVRTMQGQE